MSALHVQQLVTTLSRGGAQLTVLETSEPRDGVMVTILAGPDDLGEGDVRRELTDRGIPLIEIGSLHRRVGLVGDARCLVHLVNHLRRTRPDILHTHSTKAGVLGRLAAAIAHVPVVHTVHGWSFASCSSRVTRTAVVWLERILAHFCERLVVVTVEDRLTGESLRVGRPEQYALIRSGIDMSAGRLTPAERERLRNELLGGDEGFVVGTVARLAKQKRLDDLLEGFALSEARRAGARLVVVGDGPERAALEEQACQLGLDGACRFLGARDDAARLVGAFDVFALTSGWEGLPRAVIEAMAAKVPVIATAVGGIPEVVVHGETGLLIAVGDRDALATAIDRLEQDPTERMRLSQAAWAGVDEFSVEAMRTDTVRLWRDVAAARRVAA